MSIFLIKLLFYISLGWVILSKILLKSGKESTHFLVNFFLNQKVQAFAVAITLISGLFFFKDLFFSDTPTEAISSVKAEDIARNLVKNSPLLAQIESHEQREQFYQEQIQNLTETITALAQAGQKAQKPLEKQKIEMALQELEKGNTEKAKALFSEILEEKAAEGLAANREAAAAARHLGALAFLNNTQEALTAYQRATELEPDNPDSWNQLGHLLYRVGKLSEAEQAYQNVLNYGEKNQDKEWQAIAYGNLGNIYWEGNELQKAENIYSKALEINKKINRQIGVINNYGNLGNIYSKRGELEKAKNVYFKILDISILVSSYNKCNSLNSNTKIRRLE